MRDEFEKKIQNKRLQNKIIIIKRIMTKFDIKIF
jgi:hypothetical protein